MTAEYARFVQSSLSLSLSLPLSLSLSLSLTEALSDGGVLERGLLVQARPATSGAGACDVAKP